MGELAVVDVDRADVEAHDLGVLDRQMPQTANAGDGDPFARPRPSLLDALVGGDARADDRRGILGRKAGGHVGDVIRVGEDVLGKTTVLGVAAKLRLCAHSFPCG